MSLLAVHIVACVLLGCGIAAILVQRDALGILMGIELALNAAAVHLVGTDRLVAHTGAGSSFALLIIVIAAAEAAVALAIFLAFHRAHGTTQVEAAGDLRG